MLLFKIAHARLRLCADQYDDICILDVARAQARVRSEFEEVSHSKSNVLMNVRWCAHRRTRPGACRCIHARLCPLNISAASTFLHLPDSSYTNDIRLGLSLMQA